MRNAKFWDWYDGYAVPRLTASPHGPWRSRAASFRSMFEHLDRLDRPVTIIETGALEDPDNFQGNGCSSILFDRYVAERDDGSQFFSVDISPIYVEVTRSLMTGRSTVVCGDSAKALEQWSQLSVDLLYLDASHLDFCNELPSQEHHLRELRAIMPALHGGTLVAVDDSPAAFDAFPHLIVRGKGGLVAQHALNVGAEMIFCEYHVGWTKMTNPPEPQTLDMKALIQRARNHVDARRLIQADQLYTRILALTPGPWGGRLNAQAHAEACVFFAANAVECNKHGLAMDWYHEALSANAGDLDARMLLARTLRKLGMHEAAVAQSERATRIAPNDHLTWKSLGDSALALADASQSRRSEAFAAAVAAYEKEGETAPPDFLDWKLDRAAVAADQEDYATVLRLADEMTGTPIENDSWHLRGMAYARFGNHEKAIECYDKAIAMKARDLPQVHWNKSGSLHAIGRYREGWIEHEWRVRCTHQFALTVATRRFNHPMWNKQPPPAIIHVHGEAGAGDNIAVSRYLQLLVDGGYTVRFETLGTMEKMFRDSFPEVEVMERAVDYPGAYGLKRFDYHMPVGSLPAVFGTDIDTVPWFGPYIKADPELVERYQPRVVCPGRSIGLCWSSGIRLGEGTWLEKYGRKKSMHYQQIEPLFWARDIEDVLVNLQVGPEREQHRGELLDPLPEKPSWAETAALVACLDLVITVDTGIAHLAGAMGKPVWIVMHTEGSWHFMVERPGAFWNERSPWYPSARIFRAKRPGEWAPVIERIAVELRKPELAAAE